jgi:dTDP-4-dehydrorhamnose 3,5-epimerase
LLVDKPYEIELQNFVDDRGLFVVDADDLGVGAKIKRCYHVANHQANIIRGFHKHEKERKYFTAVSGSFKIVATDINGSIIYKFVTSVKKPKMIVIPPTYYNGNMSLEDNSVLLCLSTSTTEESIADDQRVDPYTFGDVWSIKGR